MPTDLRKQLEDEAERNGRSISQEILHRVQFSFSQKRGKAIDPSIRALSFLMLRIQHSFRNEAFVLNDVWSPPVTEGRHWRTDPFFYTAFKFAVQTLLDKFVPVGNDPPVTNKTPVEVGIDIGRKIWWELNNPQAYDSVLKKSFEELEVKREDPAWRDGLKRLRQEFEDIVYGLVDAKRDLQLKTEGEQK
jgi:hypothetical protein